MSPLPDMPASTTRACGCCLWIASSEICTSRAYFPGETFGAKYFFRLGSFQICQDWIGSGLASAPYRCW